MSPVCFRQLVFSFDLVSLYPPVLFLSSITFPMSSLLLQIAMVKSHLPGIKLSGFLIHVNFFPLLSIPLSSFSWISWWSFWNFRISFTYLTVFWGPYHMPFCRQSMTCLHVWVPFWSPHGCVEQCRVAHLFFFSLIAYFFFFRKSSWLICDLSPYSVL